jgi:hypothetical protein
VAEGQKLAADEKSPGRALNCILKLFIADLRLFCSLIIFFKFACWMRLEPAVIPPIIRPIMSRTIDNSTRVKPE